MARQMDAAFDFMPEAGQNDLVPVAPAAPHSMSHLSNAHLKQG
jgi:hypothetical protein